MKRVLFFARDPGGANTIIPLIKAMEDTYEVMCYGKEFAISRIWQEGIKCLDICDEIDIIDEESICLFLKDKNIDAVVTATSLDDYTERYIWKAAKTLGIFSVAILDQWMNMGIRFSEYNYTQKDIFENNHKISYLPDKIFVMDELAKHIMVNEGVPEANLCITGQPHFDMVKKKYEAESVERERDALNVIYVSEPIIKDYDNGDETVLSLGYNERTIFDELYNALQGIVADRTIRCIVRPHPREDGEAWKEVFERYSGSNIVLDIDGKTDTFELLHKADVVCGMSSMFLLESIICKIPTVSILIGVKEGSPFILDKIGSYKSIKDINSLIKQLDKIINQEGFCVDFQVIQDATRNALNIIEEELK